MPQSYRSRFLSIQAANERRMAALFRALAAGIAGDVTRRADADGNVPRTATFDLQRLAGERIQRLYLGMSRSGQLAPFEIGAGGKVIPLSPYMQALWDAITAAVRIPVEQNAAILAKRLPPDVLAVMRAAPENPFATARGQVTEIEVFKPNPLAQYEAPHAWVDPRGYRLSDRVWDTAGSTRRAIDAYLEDAIRQGKGALAMSKELVQFLDPSQLPIKTNKPYGTKASFSAMRLARTEITRAHGEAHKVAGAMNPFVAGDKWNLSSRHPKPDICDRYARGGPNGDGLYPTGELPPYPPHPQCLCNLTYAMVSDPDAIIAALRKDIRQARAELVNQVGPLQVEQFDKLLLGQYAPAPALPLPAAIPTPPVVVPRPAVPPAPTAPTKVDLKPLKDGKATIAWEKAPLYANRKLNGVALKEVKPGYWAKVPDVAVGEPALPTGQRVSTGLIVVEPDGRIWLVEPRGHFGGYEHTFPRGGLEAGLTAQQNALKEVWEEAGLKAEITGYVGDFKGTTSTTRYYIAKRTGGAPWATDDETATVKLVPMDVAQKLLNTQRDQDILTAVKAKLAAPPPVPVAPTVPVVAAPPPLPIDTSPLPGLDELRLIKRLGGSTGAQLFEGPGGKRYVVKGGNSDAHIRSEFLADELYRAMGANVPRARLVQKDGQTFKIAEYIDGKLLNELSGDALAAAHAQLQKHFAADALLASWDVIGAGADNVIVDAAGKAWRIDNGGSLLFRAQGAPKAMGNYIDELWTLRDAAVNGQTNRVFGDMAYGDIANQLSAIVSQRDDIIGRIADPNLRTIMTARLDHAADLAGIYRTFHDDKYVDSYVDRFSYHNTWIQSSGVTSTLPQRLTQQSATSSNVILIDESGKEFDDLRGRGGIYARFLKELDARTGKKGKEFIRRWADAQAGDSWSPLSRLVKQRMMVNRPSSSYYWKDTDSYMESALAHFRTLYSDSAVDDMAAALNALSYETLRRVEVGKRPAPGVLTLLRTESDFVLDRYGMQRKKGSRATIERGALESTSLLKPVVVMGGNLTEQDIPIHRVMGFYGFGTDKTMYLNDRENELLVLLDGHESRYARKVNR